MKGPLAAQGENRSKRFVFFKICLTEISADMCVKVVLSKANKGQAIYCPKPSKLPQSNGLHSKYSKSSQCQTFKLRLRREFLDCYKTSKSLNKLCFMLCPNFFWLFRMLLNILTLNRFYSVGSS